MSFYCWVNYHGGRFWKVNMVSELRFWGIQVLFTRLRFEQWESLWEIFFGGQLQVKEKKKRRYGYCMNLCTSRTSNNRLSTVQISSSTNIPDSLVFFTTSWLWETTSFMLLTPDCQAPEDICRLKIFFTDAYGRPLSWDFDHFCLGRISK